MTGVVGEAGERDSSTGVAGEAELDVAGLAGLAGDRSDTAGGGCLVGVVAAIEERADLGDDLSEVDLADAWQRGEELSFGCASSSAYGGLRDALWRHARARRDQRSGRVGQALRRKNIRRTSSTACSTGLCTRNGGKSFSRHAAGVRFWEGEAPAEPRITEESDSGCVRPVQEKV